jgi:hypothetical protein
MGPFRLVRADGDPRLLAEEVSKRGEVFGGREWGGGVNSP